MVEEDEVITSQSTYKANVNPMADLSFAGPRRADMRPLTEATKFVTLVNIS